MSDAGPQRWLWTFLIAAVLCAGYWFVKWGVLRVRVALGEEQTQYFEECRSKALDSSEPEEIVGFMEAAIRYYPSGTKQATGSHLDCIVERTRQWAIEDIAAHLRQMKRQQLDRPDDYEASQK